MNSEELVVINGQLCSKKFAAVIIDKILPTVLEVVAHKLKDGRSAEEVKEAAKTVVSAATDALIIKSLTSPTS